jgi:lysozyme family protein
MNFDAAVKIILAYEGGYSCHPHDLGGETNFGISKRAYPNLDIKKLTVDQAVALYRRDYWERCSLDQLSDSLRLIVFDSAVNHGSPFTIKLLQGIAGTPQTGAMDDETVIRLNELDQGELVHRVARARLKLYSSLKRWPVFGRGWTERLFDVTLKTLAGADREKRV